MMFHWQTARQVSARHLSALLALVVLPLVVACGHGATTSGAPTAPTSSAAPSPSGVSGGRISGTVVVGAPRALLGTAPRAQTIAGGSLTVTVTGTGISATVDVSGHFTLDNVPAGHVDLHFTGNGVDAHLGVDVTNHNTLVVTVQVSGTDAHLDEQHNESDQSEDHTGSTQVDLSGTIATGSLAGSCAGHDLSFMIGTTKITTNGTTRFEDGSCDSLKVGSHVEVKGIRQSDNSVLATNIQLEDTKSEGTGSGHDSERDVSK